MSNTTYKPKTSRLSYRIAAYALSLLSIITPVAPSLAAQLSNSAIEAQLALDPAYEWLNSFEYQYKTPTYIENSTLNASDIDAFYQDIENEHRAGLGDPTYVPISVGKVTTIIPTYPSYKYLGTPVVQSRYIRTQINALLGRTLIDSTNSNYATESAQINTLYGNALTYIKSTPGLEFGAPLNRHQDGSGLAYDIVWPELRTINGQEVIVPVVYLSQATMEQHAVIEHETTFNGDVYVGSLTIDDVNIETGRNTFIQVADALTNGGSITSPGELKIVAGGALQNLSGKIQAEGDLVVGAHSIYSQTIVHRYDTAYDIGSRYGQVASFDSASGDVVLRSYSDINFLGSTASAGGELTLAADGNIYLGPEALQEGHRSRYENAGREATSYLQSELTAEDTIKLIASGQILIDAAEIASSEGHIELMAGMGITVQDVLASERNYKHGTYGKREIHEEAYQTVAVRSVLDAGKGIRLHTAMGDITLKGAEITSTEGAHVKADGGKVKMLMAVETDHYSYSEVKKSLFTVKSTNTGHNIETAVPNTIIGGFQAEALYGLEVEYEGDPELSFDEQVNNLSQMPGLEWMEELRNSSELSDVNWTEVSLAYEQWHESSTTLSPAAMAVLSIAIAVATQGMAAGWTETLLANTTFSATGALGTAMTAGFTSLVSQATLALANGAVAGDIAGAIDGLLSEDTLKSLAVAMVTAAAIDYVDTEFFAPPEGAQNVAQEVTLADQAVQAVTHTAVRAGVGVLAEGGSLEDFEDSFIAALKNNAVNMLGQWMATEIGEAAKAGDIDTAIQYIAHAGAGCITGVLTANINDEEDTVLSCSSGAGGAVVGEYVGSMYNDSLDGKMSEWVDDYVKKNEKIPSSQEYYKETNRLVLLGSDIARLSSALGAFAAGLDVDTASTSGYASARFNAINNADSLNSGYKSKVYQYIDEFGNIAFGDVHPKQSGVLRVNQDEEGYVVDKTNQDEELAADNLAQRKAKADHANGVANSYQLQFDCIIYERGCDLLNASWELYQADEEKYAAELSIGTPGQLGLQTALASLEEAGIVVEDGLEIACGVHLVCGSVMEVYQIVNGKEVGIDTLLTMAPLTGVSTIRNVENLDDKYYVARNAAAGAARGNPLKVDSIPRNSGKELLDQGIGTKSCGHHACAMVLDTLGKPTDPAVLLDKISEGSYGINGPQVQRLFTSNKVSTSYLEDRTIDTIRNWSGGDNSVVVRVKDADTNFSHWVVVDAITERTDRSGNVVPVAAIRDPDGGVEYYSPLTTFEKYFSGDMVIITGDL